MTQDSPSTWHWQFQGDDQWAFGPLVRGLVRPRAEVYYNAEAEKNRWVWFTVPTYGGLSGKTESFADAVAEVEGHYGLEEDGDGNKPEA